MSDLFPTVTLRWLRDLGVLGTVDDDVLGVHPLLKHALVKDKYNGGQLQDR